MYRVKEIFYSIQGEGFHAGRAAVFLRFSGCNLWNGLETGRSKAACQFCDTDFYGTDGTKGGEYETASRLVQAVADTWGSDDTENPIVICTGGEPLLQLDRPLIEKLHIEGFRVHCETNGTLEAPDMLDWITVSPKAGTRLVQDWGDELKIVYPQIGIDPANYEHLPFGHFYVQPMDSPLIAENSQKAVKYCLDNPQWKISTQLHKRLQIR